MYYHKDVRERGAVPMNQTHLRRHRGAAAGVWQIEADGIAHRNRTFRAQRNVQVHINHTAIFGERHNMCSQEWLNATHRLNITNPLTLTVDCNHRWFSAVRKRWMHDVCISDVPKVDSISYQIGGLWPIASTAPKRWVTIARVLARTLDGCPRGERRKAARAAGCVTAEESQESDIGRMGRIGYSGLSIVGRAAKSPNSEAPKHLIGNARKVCRYQCRLNRATAIHFFGASVTLHFMLALQSEARRTLGVNCDMCFGVDGPALMYTMAKKTGALGCGNELWRLSHAKPYDPAVKAQLRNCTKLVPGGPMDETLLAARVIVVGYRIAHYGGGGSPGHYATLEEDIRALTERALQLGKRVMFMSPSAQHFPHSNDGGTYDRASHRTMMQSLSRGAQSCLCVPNAKPAPIPREVLLYQRLAAEYKLPLFDLYNTTQSAHNHHIGATCGHYAPRTVNGVRTPEAVLLNLQRDCCDCTHFCHTPSFWQRVGIKPFADALSFA